MVTMTLFKDMAEKEFSFSTAFSVLCTDLPQRSRDISASRFGIDAARALTLEAIGKNMALHESAFVRSCRAVLRAFVQKRTAHIFAWQRNGWKRRLRKTVV